MLPKLMVPLLYLDSFKGQSYLELHAGPLYIQYYPHGGTHTCTNHEHVNNLINQA